MEKHPYAKGFSYSGQPIVLTECGGIRIKKEKTEEITGEKAMRAGGQDWGYTSVPDTDFLKEYERVIHEKGREYALYGTFGLSVNLFDGKYTYFRGPRDNTQCYEYTTSLTTIRDWLGKDIPEKIECGYFLPQVPFPVYKIPEVKNALVSDAVYHKEDHLFDIEEDYGQTREVADPEIRNMMEKKLSDALADNYAPEEQWARLGLKKGSDSGYNSVSEYDYTV